MNSVDKPKKVKLWKNSEGSSKKQKVQNHSSSDVAMKIEKENVTISSKKNKKKKPMANTPGTDSKPNLKRKNEAPDGSSPKKAKPNNMKRKEWKILNKKKNKTEGTDQQQEGKEKKFVKGDKKKKIEHRTGKEWKMIHKEQKGQKEQFEVGKNLKRLWEELRREDCKEEKKSQLLKQACELLKGRVKEFTFAHDTVRVLECIISEGTENHRTILFEELKNEILPLITSKYGKFCVLKMLKYGNKEQKETIIKEFHGKVIQLIRHTEAAEVVEFAFNEIANATQRHELTQEFYGPTYKFFKTAEFKTLSDLFEKDPEKKDTVIKYMKEELLKVLDKSVVKHSIVHNVLWQFMQHCDPASKSEIIEALRESVPVILHTKDGSRVAMQCVWFGTLKDRKAIIKAMKTFVVKIAMEEHGHMVLLSLFDCVDDTKFLAQKIIGELKKELLQLSQNVHGKKVLIYLLNPRDSHYIHPDVINILKTGDGNETSKKDPEIRQSELKAVIAQPLLELIKENIQNQYTDNAFCLFTLVILQHTIGDKTEAFRAISELVIEPYTTDNKNTHAVEHSGSNFLFKQLIIHDKDRQKEGDVTFSDVLINTVPKLVFKSWMECNRGAFLLVSLLETEIPSVVERIKEELAGCKTYLSKKRFKGAEILIKKLK
ncbi:hypothetical protein JTE90_027006 [Oedothorax gibbosus]|uniref:PUM-HD domain-containing protein n=1 Tax=Oedothorax gibbosus TaxID=931172 RepID=A0AAV6VB61_9ARAC|nr:hypothetical protein JTE90_027006 [Oedothorax gibbosus]